MKVQRPRPKDRPNALTGFDLDKFLTMAARERLKAKAEHRWDPYRYNYVPERYQNVKFWAGAHDANCVLKMWLRAVRVPELPVENEEQEQRMESGTYAHIRLQRKLQPLGLGQELTLYDFEHHFRARADFIFRNWQTGELAIADFKEKDDWLIQGITVEERPGHLKGTSFYPPDPSDELQVQIYLWLWRKLVQDITHSPEGIAAISDLIAPELKDSGRAPEIAERIFERIPYSWYVRYGVVLYVNRGNHADRKVALVEYDERIVRAHLAHSRIAERLVTDGTLVDFSTNPPALRPVAVPDELLPHLPKENERVCLYCPFRDRCPVGRVAVQHRGPRVTVPLHVAKKMEKLRRQKPKFEPGLEPAQVALFPVTHAPKAS
jgi:hypothetical protein